MFGFGKKRMTDAELDQRMQQIEDMSEEEALKAALALEKDYPEAAAVTLCQAYFMGNVVDQDFERCINYAKLALKKYPDRGIIWYMGGVACGILDQYEDAINLLAKARTMEGFELVASSAYAGYCHDYACQLRNIAAGTLRINVYSEGNKQAAVWYAESAAVFDMVAKEDCTQLSDGEWHEYADSVCMLLAMSYQGALTDLGAKDNKIGSWVSASFKALNAKTDEAQNNFWKDYCYGVADQMGQADKHLVAETLRQYICLLEARYEHSGPAFYRAEWHNCRVMELLETATTDEKDAWNKYCGDLLTEHLAMKKKHSAYVHNQMLDGNLPVLAPSYAEGNAPDPESCASFMEDFHRERDIGQLKHDIRTGKSGGNEKKKGGLFGLFRK